MVREGVELMGETWGQGWGVVREGVELMGGSEMG